jgi:heterodisulfide reductase subunit B
MRYAYFPGCSAESTARDMHQSTLAVAASLGIEMIEPKGWTCCGATAGHQTDRVLAAALPAANLAKIKDMGLDCVVNCAACYNRMKVANHEIATESEIRNYVSDAIGRDYDGSVKIKHFIEVLLEDVGLEKISSAIKQPLKGLKVACYYGCLLVRPPKVVNFDDPENPKSLDKLVKAIGGESIEWPYKVECCGGGLSLSRTDVVVNLTDTIQQDIKKETGRDYQIPVVYITQLLGLGLGISSKKLGFNKLMVPASNVLEKVEVSSNG